MSSHNKTPDLTVLPSPDAPDPSPPPEVAAYLSHTLPPDPGDAFFSDVALRALAQAQANAQAHTQPAPVNDARAYRPRLFAIAASFLLSSALLWYLLSPAGAPLKTSPDAPALPSTMAAAVPSPIDPTPSDLTDDPAEASESLDALSTHQLSLLSARLPALRAPLPLSDLEDDPEDDLYALDGLDARALFDLQASLQAAYKLDPQHR